MSFLIFNKKDKQVGDIGMAGQCTSAIFNYQVIGSGAVVEFSGSNKPDCDVLIDQHWEPIVTIQAGTPDSEPFRQHAWDKIRYKVIAGADVEIYVSSGVSG